MLQSEKDGDLENKRRILEQVFAVAATVVNNIKLSFRRKKRISERASSASGDPGCGPPLSVFKTKLFFSVYYDTNVKLFAAWRQVEEKFLRVCNRGFLLGKLSAAQNIIKVLH